MGIKIFEGKGNNENEVNEWLKENPSIKVQNVNMCPMLDRYSYGNGDICNQWVATIVIYTGGNE
jgi:hypothetical protein